MALEERFSLNIFPLRCGDMASGVRSIFFKYIKIFLDADQDVLLIPSSLNAGNVFFTFLIYFQVPDYWLINAYL